MMTSGHFADTQGLTVNEHNLTNSQFVVAWEGTLGVFSVPTVDR